MWIALYHIPMKTSIPVLGFLQEIGYGGVDIFVYLSGYGVYKSLEKDDNAYRFLKRRLRRLMPSFKPFIVVWMIIRYITYQLYITEIAGNLTMTGWWNGSSNQFNWYVDGILLFYLLAPYLYGVLKSGKKLVLSSIMSLSVTLVISIVFWHGILLTAMSRLPIFTLGMIVSASDKNGIDDILKSTWFRILLCISSVFGFAILYYLLFIQDFVDRWHYGLWWYPFLVIVPGLVYILGLLCDALGKMSIGKVLLKLLECFGKASFEIFLIHIFVFESAGAKCIEGKLQWCLLFIISFVIGCGYYCVVSWVKQTALTNGVEQN